MIGISAVVEKFKHMLRLLSKAGIITADSTKTMKLGIRDRVLAAGWMARRVAEVIVGVSRFVINVRSIGDNLAGRPVAAHFNQPDHSLNHVSITGILSTSGNSDFERHVAEQRLINSLKTLKPSGINVKFDIFKCYWIV